MKPSDLEEGIDWMEVRWGYQKKWEKWGDLFPEFAMFSAGALMETLNSWFRAGNRFAPGPAELRKAIAEVSRKRIEFGIDTPIIEECTNHVFAAPFYSDTDRRVQCVNCGEHGGIWIHKHSWCPDGSCLYCPSRQGEPEPTGRPQEVLF